MKFVFLILLFAISCTDNKKEQETMIEVNTNTISQETNTIPEPPKSIELSYENSLEIMLVESTINKVQEYILERYLEKATYEAVYWDSNNNTYYLVTNKRTFCHPITNTNFIYTVDEIKQIEPIFYPDNQEIFTNTGAPLLYVGDLSSPLERVYLDPTNQVYYIKQLTLWDTSIYEEMTYTNDGEYNHSYKMVTNTTSTVYPAKLEQWASIMYTNENKQRFSVPAKGIFGDDTFYMPILYYNSGDLIIVNQ